MGSFIAGQRWMSESEPELGLGTVVEAGAGRVRVSFSAAGEDRTYASDNAPLKRVRFRAGDTIQTREEKEFTVNAVTERGGLFFYRGDDGEVPEAELDDRISLHGPEDRLFAGRFDPPGPFDLRYRTLTLQHRARKSSVRGFVGGRIDLIPHQLYIAREVADRYAPRVLLADEVGLGKTIEACLILHRLLLTGRAERVLVLVPESLVHQWFVEMLRRFNVRLNIFDEERCAAIAAGDPEANPFLDDQLILTSIDLLAGSPRRSAQAVEAGWDVLVVDEAHHLEWSPTAPSREYQVVEALSRQAEGLLLLTATPEQLGVESHFARLRLLDPDRFGNLESFLAESQEYRRIAEVAEKLMRGERLASADETLLREWFSQDPQLETRLSDARQGQSEVQRLLLDDLLDMHGPGRVMFRNTRAAMSGFPKRHAHLAELHAAADTDEWLDRLATEFAADAGDANLSAALDLAEDPRILWLVRLLRELEPRKVLLICRRVEKVEAIDEALRRHLNIKTGIFHEGLTLLQRDRNAAWFADPEGARLLICSEIGSEGRNFQFAHHLVLFDLPLNPELLEQRIGRLDRIGQTTDIQIHVPYVSRSPQEVLARWYHEGLDAFETNLEGGTDLLRRFGRRVHDVALEFPVAEQSAAELELTGLLTESASARREIRAMLERGRDRLLEMNSFRPAVAQATIRRIQQAEEQQSPEEYMLDMLEHFGVRIEELAPHTWHLHPEGVITDAFPAMPAEGMIATCDRQRALAREDVGFLTWDHPMVTGAMELLLGSETGNCAFAVFPVATERALLLEAVFVLETIAASRLHADRFLPATPVRLVVDQNGEDLSETHRGESFRNRLQKGSPYKLIENASIVRQVLPAMLDASTRLAEAHAAQLREAALKEVKELLGHEVGRLKALSRVNNRIRPQEIQLAEKQQAALHEAVRQSRLRLDALQLIWKGPTEMLR